MNCKFIKAPLAMAVLTSLAMPAWAADATEVTAYRPSVSNPADLPTPGQLELEFGGLHEKKGSARNDSLPYLFKLAFTREWGVLLGGDAQEGDVATQLELTPL